MISLRWNQNVKGVDLKAIQTAVTERRYKQETKKTTTENDKLSDQPSSARKDTKDKVSKNEKGDKKKKVTEEDLSSSDTDSSERQSGGGLDDVAKELYMISQDLGRPLSPDVQD